MNKVMTTQTIAKAKEMKLAGKKTLDIAEELGVNPYTLKTHLKGIPSPNRTKVTDEQKKQIVALHQQGLSTYQIGDELDLAQSTVQSYIRKAKKEPASSANNASSKVSDDRGSVNPVLTDDYNKLQEKCQVLGNALRLAHKGIIAQYEEMTAEQQQAFDLGQLCSEIEYRMKQGGIDPDV